jgi:hypothetical protein
MTSLRSWISAFLILLLASSTHAVEMLGAPRVAFTEGAATITWQTDVPCGTRLSLGTELNKLAPKAEGAVTAEHSVTLPGLTPGVTYFYSIGSARQKLGAGTFTVPTADQAATGAPPSRPPTSAKPVPAPASSKSVLERLRDVLIPKQPSQPQQPQPSAAAAQAPPSARTWGDPRSLLDHYARHGADFQSRNAEDYAAKAWLFLQRARTQPLPMKLDQDRTLRVYDPQTGSFAAYNSNGTTKTFFKPNNPTYWQRQPGRLVAPSELPSSLQPRR